MAAVRLRGARCCHSLRLAVVDAEEDMPPSVIAHTLACLRNAQLRELYCIEAVDPNGRTLFRQIEDSEKLAREAIDEAERRDGVARVFAWDLFGGSKLR